MSVNVPKNGKQKPDKKPTKKFGRELSGNGEKPKDCEITRYVAIVELKVKYPIIPIMKFTDMQNISISPLLSGYATSVIEVPISKNFNVPSANALLQTHTVKSAIGVLMNVIKHELLKARNGGARLKTR